MRGLPRAFLFSVLVHAVVVALVYALPVDRSAKPDIVLMDFTLVNSENLPEGFGGTQSAPFPAARLVKTSSRNSTSRADSVQPSPVASQPKYMEERRDERVPAADPAQGYESATSLSPEPGPPEARLLATGGEAHPGSPGGSKTSAEGEGRPGHTAVAGLSHGAAGASGDVAGAGHAAVLRQIRDSVMKNVVYPERARRMGWEGKVIVQFTVHEDGSIHDARIAQSSGTLVLDEAAKEALIKSSVKARFAQKVQVFLPVEYRLK